MVVLIWKILARENDKNDDDVKLMKWLVTGGNHGTIDTCGENASLHCDETYYTKHYDDGGKRDKCVGSGRLIDACAINTPAKMIKLELGCQVPIKSPFKFGRDVIKRMRNKYEGRISSSLFTTNSTSHWSNKCCDIVVNEYRDPGPIELSLPNSRIGFFDECVTQRVYSKNPDPATYRYHDLNVVKPYDEGNSYVGHMMALSEELVTFSVGGPRFFENNTVVESFNEWGQENLANREHLLDIYHHCSRVYCSPLFRTHYDHPTNPRILGEDELVNGDWWEGCNRHSDPFQDTNHYDYVSTQLSHLPTKIGYDPDNLLTYLPLYGSKTSMKDLMTRRHVYESFFHETTRKHLGTGLILWNRLNEIV